MKCFRSISKPFKRFFFSHADNISDKWIKNVSHKYSLKYINKIKKINNQQTITKLIDENNYPLIHGLVQYKCNLDFKLQKEKGLGHGKVREYWLRRGPRVLIFLLLTLLITILLAEILIDTSYSWRIYSVLLSVNMLFYNIYMLYYRLIDSISGAMMRIGHDHYTSWKNIVVYKRNHKITLI